MLHGFLDTHLLIHLWCDIARNRVGAGIGRRQDEDLRVANGRDVKTNALNAVTLFSLSSIGARLRTFLREKKTSSDRGGSGRRGSSAARPAGDERAGRLGRVEVGRRRTSQVRWRAARALRVAVTVAWHRVQTVRHASARRSSCHNTRILL